MVVKDKGHEPSFDRNPQTNPLGRPPISERDFIRNEKTFTSLPFWLWIALTAVAASLIWGSTHWFQKIIYKEKSHDLFLEVTNREFSLFLWQFPSFMRVHYQGKNKTGYLPGFLTNTENFSPVTAEEFVSAPPELIFLYHIWHRLLAPEDISRPIAPQEFEQFLEQLSEWNPKNWLAAPESYRQLVSSQDYLKVENLQTLSLDILPLNVRQAFLGWKNYFKEGEQINKLEPTFGQVKAFLEKHAHYARNFWRNISEINGQKIAGLEYLSGFVEGTFIPDAHIPQEQLSPFLKVALYNAEQASKNQ